MPIRRVTAAGAALACIVAMALSLPLLWHGAATAAGTLLGCAFLVAGLRRHRPDGPGWRLLAASMGLNVASTLAWYAPVFVGGDAPLPQPSLADVGWVVSDGLLAAGLVVALTRRERPLVVLLDTLSIVVGVGLVFGVLLIGPAVAAGTSPPILRVSQVAYVAVDVMVFAAIVRVLLAPRGRPPALWLLAGTGTALLVSDILWNRLMVMGDYMPGSWADLGWGVMPLLLGLAALHGSMRRLSVGEDRTDGELQVTSPLVLGVASLIAPLLLAAHSVVPSMPDIDNSLAASVALVGGGVVLGTIVVVRFLLLVSRARKLADAAETKLDRSEERHRQVVEQFPGVLVLFKLLEDAPAPVPVFVSPQSERILGIAPAEWLADGRAVHERIEGELRLAQKLEAVGQLAAGIAHEINTPIQFVGDTIRFLQDAFADLQELQAVQDELRDAAEAAAVEPALLARLREAEEIADLEYLRERVPAAFERAGDGISRVATIVRAMRDFAHPPTAEKEPADLLAALHDTLIVAMNTYKYVADVETDFEELPAVVCNIGEVNQVFLNLIVNAAHAIESVVGDSGERGTITIRARAEGDHVRVSIADTGAGIPAGVAARVFDPFFTTKDVGRGTGQGLAIARTMTVERHGGSLTFETEPGHGTTFHVRLPIGTAHELAEAA